MKMKRLLGDVEVNRDLILLLTIGGLYSLGIALSNTFVNIYLWKQSKNFFNIGLYNLAVVVAQPVTFALAGRMAKKIDRIVILRLGVSALALFFITVLFAGTNASRYILPIGSVLGVGYGFYWLAYNLLTFEITEPDTRDFFNGFLGLLTSLSGMIGPILSGYLISRMTKWNGYTFIFFLSLILFTISVILSFFLSRRECDGRYELLQVFRERKKDGNWRKITIAHFFQGLREGTFVFVISIYVYIATNSEFAIGKFGLISSGVSFICYYLATRFIKDKLRKKAILAGGILLYASVYLVIINVTYYKLLLYAACIAIAYPILLVPYMSMTYDVIGKARNIKELRVEYIVVRELFLNFGRICSILAFLAAVRFFVPEKSLPVLLAVLGAGHFLIYFAIRNVTYHTKQQTKSGLEVSRTKQELTEGEG
ncbi:MAG: MFS transporter [Ectobacillus sp.]